MNNEQNHPRKGRRRGPGKGGPQRTRRGTAARSAIALLSERPMHGYEIIAELEQRTEGRWRPSPGSIYPTLARLEEKGLIEGNDGDSGKRQYTLTDAGRQRWDGRDPEAPLPWTEATGSMGRGELRHAIAELEGQARQIGRFGTDEQRTEALRVLDNARSELYAILAK